LIEIINIENPFEPKINNRTELVYLGTELKNYTGDVTGKDVFLDGEKLETIENVIPTDNSQIVITPHIAGGGLKSILGSIAMIALSVYTGGIVGGAWGGIFKAGHLITYLAAGAVMYLGGRIINSIFPQQTANYSDNQSSQTYGWDLPTISTVEGGVIGETYGTCIPQAQLLEEHVETADDGKQYLNLLYCGGYGPVDEITDIRIDSTPIDCFQNVQIEKRLGTNDQEPISFFKDTPVDQSVQIQLDEKSEIIRTTDSTRASSLEVTLEWSNGLYHLNNDGNYESASVKFDIFYRKTGTSDWTLVNHYTETNSTGDGFRKSYKWVVSDQSRYDVKVVMTSKPSGTRYMTSTTWSLLTAYNSGVYNRPNKVLIGLRILATNQLSGGIPNLNWRQTRKTVYVYNPNLNQYQEKSAQNPIWACYDILHGCKKIRNINTNQDEYVVSGCKHEHLDKYFEQWCVSADYADELIKNHDGQMEKRYQFDAFYDTSQKRFDAATKAANIGHSAIIIHGVDYGIVTDKPATMTQVFSEGRTTLSSINGTFTAKSERAHSIEVTYNDSQNDFKNTQFTLRSDDYLKDKDGQDNTASLQLFGVSRRSQAYREAVTALATNERQLQFVELSTDIDGLVAEYGDVVGYSHTVSRIGVASGRLLNVKDNVIQLDKKVELNKDKSYEIYFTLKNDRLVKKEIVAVDGETDKLTVSVPFSSDEIPEQYDCYSLGETNKAVKPYRIVSASRDGDFLVKLKLAEYDESIYATELDYSNYPDIDYTNSDDLYIDVINQIKAEETISNINGHITSDVNLNWTAINSKKAQGFQIIVTNDKNDNAEIFTTNNNYYVYKNAKIGTTYTFVVRTRYDGFSVGSKQTTLKIRGKIECPPDITGFRAIIDDLEKYKATLIWDALTIKDLDYYKIMVADKEYHTSANTIVIQSAVDSPTVSIVAVDKSGNASEHPAILVVNITSKPPDKVENIRLIKATDGYIVSFNAVENADYYEIRTDANAGNETGLLCRSLTTSCAVKLPARTGTLHILAKNIVGVYSPDSSVNWNYDRPVVSAKETKVYVVLTNLVIESTMPENAEKMLIKVTGVNHTERIYFSNSGDFSTALEPDVYTVNIAYADEWGQGDWSTDYTLTVKATFDPAWIQDASISIGKVDAEVKTAIDAGKIAQDSITQVVANLNKDPSKSTYSALTQLNDGLNLRVVKGDVINQINLTAQGTTIDGKYLHITGTTQFDDNVIVNRMIQSNAVTADKINVSSLSALCATIGTLRTATSGARVEIADNLIKVYDANNQLRVRMGVW
jgi:predicted phage tail protein